MFDGIDLIASKPGASRSAEMNSPVEEIHGLPLLHAGDEKV